MLKDYIVKTNALEIADSNNPFWLTSGLISPFYMNTHYLYNGKDKAEELLKFIDNNIEKDNFFDLLKMVLIAEYEKETEIFYNVINEVYENIKKLKSFQDSDYISGGERRDWIFSFPISYISNKPHLFITKDKKVYDIEKNEIKKENLKIFHISDLITEASSYIDKWIPAIENIKGKIIGTASIVDRNQGGSNKLTIHNINVYSCIVLNYEFLKSILLDTRKITDILSYIKNPIQWGKDYLIGNQSFFYNSICNNNVKTNERAKKCYYNNTYNFTKEQIKLFNFNFIGSI